MNVPWWVTVITIAATGTFTLLTQWLTTSLSNRQARQRLHIELNHGRRVEVYEELGEALGKLLQCLPDTAIPLTGQLLSDDAYTILTVEWPKICSGVDLIASNTVRKQVQEISLTFNELSNLNFIFSNIEPSDESVAQVAEKNRRAFAYARDMREAMRKDLGNI
jgi:hypothetical protein